MKKLVELTIIVVAAILVVLHFAGLGRMSIWIDEAVSYNCSVGPWLRFHIGETNIPPMYYLLANLCLNIRNSETFLRLPAAMAGALCVPVAYMLAGELGFSRVAKALIALVVSLSPWLFLYSQEARSYSLLMLFSLLSALAFLRMDRGKQWWLLGGIFLAMGFWSHYVIVFVLAALWANASMFRREKSVLLGLSMATAIAILLFAPWAIYTAIHPPHAVSIKKPWTGELAAFAYGWFPYFFGFSLGPSIRELRTEGILAIAREWPMLSVGVATILLPLLKIRGILREKGFVFCLVCSLVPPVIVFALSLIPRFNITYHPRYAAVSGIFLTMAWLWLAMKFRFRAIRWSILAIMFALMGVSVYNFFFNHRYYKEDIRSAAEVLKAERGPGEAIYIASGNVGLALNYYYGSDFTPIYPWTDQDTIRLMGERVWLVVAREWEVSPERLEQRLMVDHRLAGQWDFTGAKLLLYERP
ncbi:MAG: glycosyltransferase family 39 protein [candidate division WOR-3 bacterium]